MTSSRRHPNQRELASLPAELRRTTVPPVVAAWVTRQTGASIESRRRLPGASTTAVHILHLSDGRRLVLRRYVWPGFLEDEPEAPRRELDALRLGFSRGLQVPEVVAADLTGDDVGDGVPVVLMTRLTGRAIAVPDPSRLAEVAASIHSIGADDFHHRYFPWYQETISEAPAATTWPALWETAIELWHNEMPTYHPTFIHRDFHTGNLLWLRGRPSGTVDWANACRGPWGCDIATCRRELIGSGGAEVAERFRSAYEALTGRAQHPFWEMACILEASASQWTPRTVAEQEPHLASAVQAMTDTPRRR